LDPETKEPVPEGRPGILTFTHINFHGTVLVRYFTGDLINGLVWNRCEKCGLTIPRLVTPMCRAVKDFAKIKGSRVSMLGLQTAIRNSDGVEIFRVVITKEHQDDQFSRDWVRIHVAKRDDIDEDTVIHSIKKNVKYECEIGPSEIVFEPRERIEEKLFERTGLKADWIVDERKV
jgi:phenylacetate-CoA ligase